MRRALLAAFLLLVALGCSQGPTPGKGELAKTKPYKSQANADQTADADRPATLAQVQALLVQEEAKQQERERLAKAASDGWGLLFNGLLVFVGFSQVALVWWTNKLTAKAVKAAQDSAKAAVDSVNAAKEAATDAKTTSSTTLDLTRKAANAATKSAEVAEKTLIDNERPWLIFPEPTYEPQRFGALAEPAILAVSVSNSGKSPAFLVSFQARTYVGEAVPHDPFVCRELFRHRNRGVLVPGESRSLHPLATPPDIGGDGKGFFVSVAVRYRDAFGRKHRSICVWEYVPRGRSPGFERLLMSEFEQYT